MKTVFLALVIGGLAFAAPQNVQLIYDNQAIIQFCPEGSDGCVKHITLGNKRYLLAMSDPSTQYETLQNLEGAYHFHKMEVSQPGKVVGFSAREKGHFPNPTATFDVFYVIGMDYPLPK